MSDTTTRTIKLKVFIDGDKEEVNRVYKYLRDARYVQNKAYNYLISNVYAAIITGKSKDEINEIYQRGSRKPKEDDKDYSLYSYENFKFPTGLPICATVYQRVKADLQTAKKQGLFKGSCSLPNKRLDAPLLVESRFIEFYHNYDNYNEFLDNLYTKSDTNVYIKFVNGIVFKVCMGCLKQTQSLRNDIQRIFEEYYSISQSQIILGDKKIFLNLTLQQPREVVKLDENTVVGVDLGIAVPAVCGLNNKNYSKFIGSSADFLRVRTQDQTQLRNCQKSIKFNNGGHGRKKKLKPLDRFKKHERNFVDTYNHQVSSAVVEFAKEHKAKYINVEDLSDFDTSQFILRNWSFYDLQLKIKSKADKYGIEVRKINPAYTSQTCSCCGNRDAEQRIDQAHFECKKCGLKLNADLNASRNIAKSTDFVEETAS